MIYAFSVFLMYYAMKSSNDIIDKTVIMMDKQDLNSSLNPIASIVVIINGMIPIWNVLNALVLMLFVFAPKDLLRNFLDRMNELEERIDKNAKND